MVLLCRSNEWMMSGYRANDDMWTQLWPKPGEPEHCWLSLNFRSTREVSALCELGAEGRGGKARIAGELLIAMAITTRTNVNNMDLFYLS